ncbi:NAD(P)H-dependent oxidoreductase [Microbacterium esteraromaticum]|uniref:NAD(P)H-dependent oxidoreductase n=1 Tax=Microbacterium esteraromaticum TaxID=57043 RepID=A0A7D8AIX3_9MICO|nr:NADPH-dependent FMN reductase [Microbacterium esteraromaticum]QMU96649.1 NAD(P)H-dependent oxidoreductase [Microbacterium esteraromaticum]
MSESQPRISIIVGSTRPVRIGRQLADSIAKLLARSTSADVRILDLREIDLPMLDEPLMAGMNQYTHPHTFAWADEIRASDAIVFLTPQYNAGYPAALKNAIDYIYAEWQDRPAAIVSYGGHGGAASAKQLREVLEFIGMDLIDIQPQLVIRREDYTADWHLGAPDVVVDRYSETIGAVGAALESRVQGLAAA